MTHGLVTQWITSKWGGSAVGRVESERPHTVPTALVGRQRLPLVGIAFRLWDIVMDPTGLVERCRAEMGDLFTIRIPFQFDLTYIVTREGYDQISHLDPEIGRMGPVMQRLVAVGFGYRRSDMSEPHLQDLLLLGRAFMRDVVLNADTTRQVRSRVQRTVRSRAGNWSGEVDLSDELVALIHDAAGLCVSGEALWDEIGDDVARCMRVIVEGINIPRTALCSTPFARLTPEYRRTRELERVLDAAIAKHDREGCFPLIGHIQALELHGQPLHPDDVSWMLMYVMWNALNYPGSYGFWSFVEAIEDQATSRRLAESSGPERRELLANGLWETLRRHPVASLVRENRCPVDLVHEGRSYRVPPGGLIGVFPRALNRDPERYADPDQYDPERYQRGEPFPEAFGRGDYGCIAHRFVKELLVTLEESLFEAHRFELIDTPPERTCRVHLLLPSEPLRARVEVASEPIHRPAAAPKASQCPVTGWMRS